MCELYIIVNYTHGTVVIHSLLIYHFTEGEKACDDKSLQVKHEPPFSDWLYQYISRVLGNVESQEDNLRDLGYGLASEEINEYAGSRADLVIRKCQ